MREKNLSKLLDIEKKYIKEDIPKFQSGDIIKVYIKVGEGKTSRTQIFQGTVIRRRGTGINKTFTVRKISYGIGVERTFPLYSPIIEKIELVSKGKVRRAKLYYIRKRTGKKAKVRKKVTTKNMTK
jgi:large subunit ribosomal protein L19